MSFKIARFILFFTAFIILSCKVDKTKQNGTFIHEKDTIKCDELHITYDENGNIKERGCQGFVSNADISTGMSVGTWYYYKNGKLIREMYFHNAEFGKDYIKYKIYDNKGKYKELITNNFILYETDSMQLSSEEIKKREVGEFN